MKKVTCENTFTMKSKDEFVFVNFKKIHPIILSFVNNLFHVTCLKQLKLF